jgi:hypothetical protein
VITYHLLSVVIQVVTSGSWISTTRIFLALLQIVLLHTKLAHRAFLGACKCTIDYILLRIYGSTNYEGSSNIISNIMRAAATCEGSRLGVGVSPIRDRGSEESFYSYIRFN